VLSGPGLNWQPQPPGAVDGFGADSAHRSDDGANGRTRVDAPASQPRFPGS
jgi:hypothetical protein